MYSTQYYMYSTLEYSFQLSLNYATDEAVKI